MYSTQKNLDRECFRPGCLPHLVGKYVRYPDKADQRTLEGGLRLQGLYKRSLPNLPLVTVITVCFNSANTLEKCVRSVLEQTYENVEYIVIDANSTDGTHGIVQRYDDAIDYYLSESDGGIYEAMNKGIELSHGDYILFLNSDDWYESDAIEKLVRLKLSSKCDFVSALAKYVDQDGKFLRVQQLSAFDPSVDFRMPLRHETMLIPAQIYSEMGLYDTSYRIIADRVFTANLFWKGYSHELLPEPLLNFRTSGVSSVDLDRLFAERERILKDRFPGMSSAARRDIVDHENLTPARLLEISRFYHAPEFRAAAVAYAIDKESHGHKLWQGVDIDAFSPTQSNRSPFVTEVERGRKDSVKKTSPKVSVVLPIYNAQSTLRGCLDSLLTQTMKDFEVICINDKTPDDSQRIVDKYTSRDKRVRSFINELNVGLGASRNRGIELAQGEYIFHIDPDDVIPPNALETLLGFAQKHGSEMVRGAFLHEQLLAGEKTNSVRKGIPENSEPIINVSLKTRPELLHSTEGHWSYLYKADFARRVFYPEDLKMGQDSIFLVNALTKARSVTVIPEVVYQYRANADSAMNAFNFRKYIDDVEWRYRAWKVLVREGHPDLGEHLLFNYWNLTLLNKLNGQLSGSQKRAFFRKLFYAFTTAGNADLSKTKNPELRNLFAERIGQYALPPLPRGGQDHAQPHGQESLRINVVTTSDHGGAGLASLRCVQGLREQGHEARLFGLFVNTDAPYLWNLPVMEQFHKGASDDNIMRGYWQALSVLTRDEQKGLNAREMFSKTDSVTDSEVIRAVFKESDIVHLHWVPGVIDYDALPGIIGDKPVVWTLHDMNPFTGGCHYSEGCTNYRHECDDCPLVDGMTDLPHKAWQKKKRAYSAIKNLNIICPSEWLAERARGSSLFGDRPVHMVPNIFPANEFQPVNKLVARLHLGLPLDRKLIAFGADSLSSRRKGGDLLQASLKLMADEGRANGVEGIFFGKGRLDLCIKTHSMGYVNDPATLSLIYAAADVFAFPSREDNAPQTVIEAMLSGTPVVAFPVGNVPELVAHEQNGYIARYEDVRDFANGLAWALDDAQFQDVLLRGFRANFAASVHNDPWVAIDKHVEIYREAIGGQIE